MWNEKDDGNAACQRDGGRNLCDYCVCPVSYTHLDVYKRQVIDRARGDSTVPHSAQDSIPFQRMFPDGICRVTDNYYLSLIHI